MKKLLLVAFAILTSASMFAQTTVTGIITDAASGEPLPGANIKIERKLVGTNTDFDGAFTLIVSDVPALILRFLCSVIKRKRLQLQRIIKL